MAEKLCTLRTKGGGGGAKQEETVLWTNSAPTSNFAGQEINLSNDIDNYDYIGIKYYYNTTYQTGHADSMNLVSVNDLKKWLYQDSVRHNIGSLSMEFGGTAYSRTVYYVSNTKLRFGSSYQVGSSATSNGTCIPYSVVGCKFR